MVSPPFVELGIVDPNLGSLLIERLPVRNASAHELRPGRDGNVWIDLFGQGPPKIGMMPAQVMPRTVAMLTHRGAKLHHLSQQLVSRHGLQILIHTPSLLHRRSTRQDRVRLPIPNWHSDVVSSFQGQGLISLW